MSTWPCDNSWRTKLFWNQCCLTSSPYYFRASVHMDNGRSLWYMCTWMLMWKAILDHSHSRQNDIFLQSLRNMTVHMNTRGSILIVMVLYGNVKIVANLSFWHWHNLLRFLNMTPARQILSPRTWRNSTHAGLVYTPSGDYSLKHHRSHCQ